MIDMNETTLRITSKCSRFRRYVDNKVHFLGDRQPPWNGNDALGAVLSNRHRKQGIRMLTLRTSDSGCRLLLDWYHQTRNHRSRGYRPNGTSLKIHSGRLGRPCWCPLTGKCPKAARVVWAPACALRVKRMHRKTRPKLYNLQIFNSFIHLNGFTHTWLVFVYDFEDCFQACLVSVQSLDDGGLGVARTWNAILECAEVQNSTLGVCD